MSKFTDFYEAYSFLEGHYYFESGIYNEPDFQESLTIDVVKVNPETKAIDDDEAKNTLTNVWLECGPWESLDEECVKWEGFTHDYRLDTGGDTFEEAIVNLANLVLEHHGENPPAYGQVSDEELEKADALFKRIFSDSV